MCGVVSISVDVYMYVCIDGMGHLCWGSRVVRVSCFGVYWFRSSRVPEPRGFTTHLESRLRVYSCSSAMWIWKAYPHESRMSVDNSIACSGIRMDPKLYPRPGSCVAICGVALYIERYCQGIIRFNVENYVGTEKAKKKEWWKSLKLQKGKKRTDRISDNGWDLRSG